MMYFSRKAFNSYRKWSLITMMLIVLIMSGCKEDDPLVELNPNAGRSFIDIENEGYKVTLNASPASKGQTGTWRVFFGENGKFDDVNDPNTVFHGEPGENYYLGWELSHGKSYEASTITVSFKPLNPELITQIPDTLVDKRSLYLVAKTPKFGAQGRWEIAAGNGARLVDENSHLAQFIGKEKTKYTIKWILSYGSKEVAKEISFVTDRLQADAGEDNLDIKTPKTALNKFYTLDGFLPAGATGKWEMLSGDGSTIHSPDNFSSLFQGHEDIDYSLSWTVTLDGEESVDTLDIRFRGKWGVWRDTRDNQTYRFTEINGLEWMAENYNYAANPGDGSWYYGHAYRGVTIDGEPLESVEDRKEAGRLYDLYTAINEAPEGWRLPSPAEFHDLIISLGGFIHAKEKMIKGGETGLDLNYPGFLEFSSGADPAFRNVFSKQDLTGMYWTDNYSSFNGGANVFAIQAANPEPGLTVVFFDFYALPVRYVRDIQP